MKFTLPAQQIHESQKKLQELILYISLKSESDAHFGKVKLNKLLFFADFLAFKYLGKSITGQDYQALQQGPCPKSMLPVMSAMQDIGDIAIRDSDYYGFKQQRVFSLRRPNLNLFSGGEIALIDELITRNWDKNGTELSDESHEFLGWQLAQKGETIPYEVALLGNRQPTPKEREYGQSLEKLALQVLAA